MGNPQTDWCYKTEPDPGLNNRSIDWPRGKVLGGSSSINGLLYVRGQPEDFNHWRQLGNSGWSWEDVLPLFKKLRIGRVTKMKFVVTKGLCRFRKIELTVRLLMLG